MKLDFLQTYVEDKHSQGLVKIDVTLECDPEVTAPDYYVVKTKETYVFLDEQEADEKINEARQSSGFVGCDKKFKQGKVNKAGEEVRPDTYTVVIKLNH